MYSPTQCTITMTKHPLQAPESHSPLLQQFLTRHRIDPLQAPLDVLTQATTAFAQLPFENLTKIIKEAEAGRVSEARRWPAEVLADHWAYGTGGTCFALNAALLHLVRALGWRAEPVLADRRYGADTHCALLVWIDNRPHLLDPGYLLVRPLPLPTAGELRVRTPFNEVVLTARDGGARIDLHTVQQQHSTYRLTFKAAPVDAGEFLRAWDNSFDTNIIRYPVLSRVTDQQQLYLQKKTLYVRDHTASERLDLPADRLLQDIARQFRIAPEIVARALNILQRKGELHGTSAAS